MQDIYFKIFLWIYMCAFQADKAVSVLSVQSSIRHKEEPAALRSSLMLGVSLTCEAKFHPLSLFCVSQQ